MIYQDDDPVHSAAYTGVRVCCNTSCGLFCTVVASHAAAPATVSLIGVITRGVHAHQSGSHDRVVAARADRFTAPPVIMRW